MYSPAQIDMIRSAQRAIARRLDTESMMLPDYDRERACPTCGFDRCTTRYRPKTMAGALVGVYLNECEALVRGCPNCGFTWDERPLELRCYGEST